MQSLVLLVVSFVAVLAQYNGGPPAAAPPVIVQQPIPGPMIWPGWDQYDSGSRSHSHSRSRSDSHERKCTRCRKPAMSKIPNPINRLVKPTYKSIDCHGKCTKYIATCPSGLIPYAMATMKETGLPVAVFITQGINIQTTLTCNGKRKLIAKDFAGRDIQVDNLVCIDLITKPTGGNTTLTITGISGTDAANPAAVAVPATAAPITFTGIDGANAAPATVAAN